jgi:UDP-N-acetylmuramate dehydrogenase
LEVTTGSHPGKAFDFRCAPVSEIFLTFMPKFQEKVLLSKFSNYKIGGHARFFFAAKNEKEIAWAVAEAKSKKLPIFILGGGTNLLMSDEGWDGLVLKPEINSLKASGNTIVAGAGVLMSDLLDFTASKSLAGLEWAGGLPGTVGGAVRGNAGCFGGETKDTIVSVRSFDMKSMAVRERSAADCAFDYRDSVFKKNGSEIILSVEFRLAKGDKKKVMETVKKNIAYRAARHPLEYPNIGSIFKNVPLSAFHKEGSGEYKKAVMDATLAFCGSQFSVKNEPFPVISAAKCISETGLAGVAFGGAMISPKHPNFIVNVFGAEAHDVKNLIMLAKAEVWKKFGVDLEEEVELV